MKKNYDRVKRTFDVIIAAFGLLLLSPVQGLVALAVWRKLGSPVLFRETRPGRSGAEFEPVKFRTMLDLDPDGGLVTDEQRLTEFGKWLRSTSLDELPTLINVLRGDMSLVGPRPLLVEYMKLYTAGQARRHEVRPGITGLAQVSGRNELSWDDKFRLDIEYVDKRSLRLDLQIIARTFGAAFRRQGISAADHVTVERFRGSDTDGPR